MNAYLSPEVDADLWALPSGESSHSILASAISQVSRTERLGSFKYCSRVGIEHSDEMAPMASAAYRILAASMHSRGRRTSCLTIGSSFKFASTCCKTGKATGFFIWPRQ